MQQLQFDFTTDGGFPGGRLSHGLQLIDTVSGGIAKVYSDYAGWFVEYTDSVGDHTNQYIGDFGQYEDPIPQTITLTLDYDNDMMNLFTSSTDGVSTPYIGDTEATATTDHAITDAGFVPNQILYHNRWSGVSQIDDITYTPEPASLALLSIGGAALLRRRRA